MSTRRYFNMNKIFPVIIILPLFFVSFLEAKPGDCSNNVGYGYFCVPYLQCNKTGYINTDGAQIIIPRMAGRSPRNLPICPDHEEARRGHCKNVLDVCCLNASPSLCNSNHEPKEMERPSYDIYDDYYYNYTDDYGDETDTDYNKDIFGNILGDDVIKDFNKENKCEHFKDKGFACAEYWQCLGRDRSPIISDGLGLIDLRQSGRDHKVGCVTMDDVTLDASDQKCPGDNQVCCQRPDFSIKICSPGDESRNEKVNLSQCGRTNMDSRRQRSGRIVTVTQLNVSNAAQPGEFPHMCVIYKVVSGATVYIGGASLISRNLVLTVAHKFYVFGRKRVDERKNIGRYLVRCGEYNMKADSEIQKTQESGAEKFHFHPKYNPAHKFVPNDLLILQTKENFIYQDHVGRVCLPRPGDQFGKEDECWSSGWGKDQFGKKGKFSDILKKIDMKIVPRGLCQRKMRKARRFMRKFKLHESQVCVGGEKGKDTCTGDGGSPHVCIKDGKWIQIGAVAWGIGCGDKLPAIYSSVGPSMCWIDWVMTCHPQAEKDINQNRTWMKIQLGGGRDRRSVNELTLEECGKWSRENPRLTQSCNVIYVNKENIAAKRHVQMRKPRDSNI